MKRNENFFLEAKQSENTVYWFRFGWKRKIRSEKKRNEAKIYFLFFSRERAKRMRNRSRFASFRFEAGKILKRNQRILITSMNKDLFPGLRSYAAMQNSRHLEWEEVHFYEFSHCIYG